jgi:Uma2 family endonuclease
MLDAIREKSPPNVPSGYMTEEEFEAWCDEDVKAEWIEGRVIVHSPARPRHSLIASWLSRILGIFLRHSDLGVVMGPEIQFRVPGRRRVPDVLVVLKARLQIIGETRIDGPPDLVVEIVSPDSVERDYREKYLEYEAAGIREYWIVDYLNERLRLYVLDDAGRYAPQPEENGLVHSRVLPGFYLRTAWLWQQPLPDELTVLRELGVI